MSHSTGIYDEATLLKALAGDNETAFALLYDHYWEKIYAVAILYLKDSGLAEDIVQDTFLRIWQKRTSLEEVQNFGAYLHVVARNLIVSAFRKKTALSRLDSSTEAAALPESGWQPFQQLEHRDNEAMINQAVNRLSPRQKQIYVLSREKETSLKEVAHRLNISYDTARQYKSEALQFIRFFLKHNACFLPLLTLVFW